MKHQGKKILFVAPKFFGYEVDIAEELRRQNFEVSYIPDSLSPFYWRWANIITFGMINQKRKKKMMTVFAASYDYLLVIKGAFISRKYIEHFKQYNPNAECIMYQYDTLSNTPNSRKLFPFFNRIYSFDNIDCEKEKEYEIRFLPLFYTDIPSIQKPTRYDISIICTFYRIRYKIINSLKSSLSSSLKFKIFFYYPFFTMVKNCAKFSIKEILAISFVPLTRSQVVKIMTSSKVILDIPYENQKGLTIRTFESLSSGNKLITTNNEIKKYNFYSPNNIYILSSDSDVASIKSFINSPKDKIPDEIMRKYHISTFCKVLLAKEQCNYFNV